MSVAALSPFSLGTTPGLDLSAAEATASHDYKASERSGWHALIRPLIPCSQSHCVDLRRGWKGCPQRQIGLNKTLAAEQWCVIYDKGKVRAHVL